MKVVIYYEIVSMSSHSLLIVLPMGRGPYEPLSTELVSLWIILYPLFPYSMICKLVESIRSLTYPLQREMTDDRDIVFASCAICDTSEDVDNNETSSSTSPSDINTMNILPLVKLCNKKWTTSPCRPNSESMLLVIMAMTKKYGVTETLRILLNILENHYDGLLKRK